MKRFTTILLGTALAAALFLGAPTNMSAKSTSTSSKAKKHKKKTSTMTGHSTSTTKK
jgi:hypothetical protein